MKKITTADWVFGPYETVEVLEDRYVVNGSAHLPFSVIGQGEISEALPEDFPPLEPLPEPTPDPAPVTPTKEELLAQLQAIQAQVEAMP